MKINRFLNSLSPVKRRIAVYLIQGISPEQTAKKISKENNSGLPNATAWVTMVQKEAKAKKVQLTALKQIVIDDKAKTIEHKEKEPEHKPTYSHDPLKNKEKVRIQNRLLEEVIASGITSGIVLTLSWIKCIVESKINAKLQELKFLSCEMDRPTFKLLETEIVERSLKFMLEPLRCEIGRIIQLSAKDTFAHLFLDYCGHLSTFSEEIELAIRNKIVQKNGVIWITVSARSGKGYKGFNTKSELMTLIQIAGGRDYKIEFLENYKDGTPMTTAIIRRIK